MTTEYYCDFDFSPALDGFASMEADRILADGMNLERPVVRFYTWKRPTISYGFNQNPFRRLDIRRCLGDGIEMVARPTGGREILHGWDLCCSVIRPTRRRQPATEFAEMFAGINRILSLGLKRLGIDAVIHSVTKKGRFDKGPCFSQIDRGEISVSGKKIIASAQRIFNGAVLQQSSISIARPASELMDYLLIGRNDRKMSHIANSVAYMEDGLRETPAIEKIVKIFRDVFEAELGKQLSLDLLNNNR